MERQVMKMLVEERDGRFCAVHPVSGQNAKGKGTGQEAACEVPAEMVGILRLSYVADYDLENDSIKYSEDFYPDLFKELETGKSDVEAYKALGFDVGILGRSRANNACKKAREKARRAKALEGLLPGTGDVSPELEPYRQSPYVRVISENKIYYTEEFYKQLSKQLDDGVPPLEAYKNLGFDPGILGSQRAYKAAEHAREWKRRQMEGSVYRVGDFSGAVPLMKMMDDAGYPDNSSEWTAKLMGRVIYLETILEELKKKEVEIFGTVYKVEGRFEEIDMTQVANKFIEDLRNPLERYSLTEARALRIFEVKQSTYNGYVKRLAELADENSARAKKLAARRKEDIEIRQMIREIIKARHGFVPGNRTLRVELLVRYNKHLSIKAIRFHKQKMRLVTNVEKNPYKGQDTYLHPLMSPGNLVAGCFYLGYRRVILIDITYCKYDLGSKVCYHVEFYDPFTDQVLGMAVSDSLTVEFVKEAYEKMLRDHKGEFRNPGVYIHSDNGSQLLEISFTKLISDCGFLRSVSRPGTPGDNRPMEAKFSRLKGTLEQKLLLCKTTDQVREMIEGYIKNHEEKDACLSLGGLTPNQFEKYILTGVYPLDSYYGIDAKELHPIDGLIKKLKEIAHQRTERAKKEKADHEERMKLIMELQNVDPAAVIERDRVIALQEKVRCMKAKHACDVDIKLWEVMNERIARAVSFIRQASPEVLERLKERRNWSDYPELQYFKDFPQHRNGKIMLFDRDEMGPELAGPVSLWVAVDGFIAEVIDFFDKASEETRKLLEDPANWDSFPELSFLKNMKSGEDKKAV